MNLNSGTSATTHPCVARAPVPLMHSNDKISPNDGYLQVDLQVSNDKMPPNEEYLQTNFDHALLDDEVFSARD